MGINTVVSRPTVQFGRRTLLGGAVAGAVIAGGCQFQDTGGDAGAARIRVAQSTITTMDPHIVGDAINFATAGLMEGLVLQNDDSTDVLPGAASSWDVSDDELVYTFHMREGATWSNGDPITAQDVEWSFKRLMTPTGATANAATGSSSFQPGLGIMGANDFATGELSDWDEVGVKALDPATVEITLEERNPDFLISLTHYSMVLLHPGTVEDSPKDWMQPDNFVGSGAVLPKVWVPNSTLLLAKNESYWDADSVALDEIDLRLGGDPAANALAFKAGELDFVRLGGEVIKNDPELTNKVKKVDGYRVAYLQAMWGGHPAIQDVRVRQALSMSIDREALAALDGYSQAGTSLIPSVVPGWSEDQAVAYEPERARRLLGEGGDGVTKVRIQVSGEVAMLEVLKEQWRENLGLDLTLDILEPGLFSSTRLQPHKDSSTMSLYYGTYGGLPTINTWMFINFDPNRIRQMSLSESDWEDYQKIQSDEGLDGPEKASKLEQILRTRSTSQAQEFARLAADARNELDEARREQLYVQADIVRRDIAQSIPLLWSPIIAVVSDRVAGLVLRSSPESFYYRGISVSDA